MGELEYMINNNKIELSQFFTMHPFSATERILYDTALKDIDYFNTLYIKSYKTYERLATICNVVDNVSKNLIVVTGYRGCGKTNFLRLVEHISEGNEIEESIGELYQEELECALGIEDLKDSITENFNESLKRIRSSLFFAEEIYGADDQTINEKLRTYISSHLTGKCKYINFDEGGMGREKPFSSKLFYLLRNSIKKYTDNGRIETIINKIVEFVNRNKWTIEENFENIEYKKLRDFWRSLYREFFSFKDEDALYDFLFEELKKLDLEQLLFAYTIWEYAEISTSNRKDSDKKLLCLLDNIDMISDGNTDIFQNTMMGIWKYIWDTRNVFSEIGKKNCLDDYEFLEIYSKTKIIVAMRETTAMHISGHLRDKMRGLMEHFDMSTDVDKSMIMQKKIDFGKKLIDNGNIRNKNFIDTVTLINKLISDRYLMRNLFLLYNNDYRTSMLSLTTICIEHLDEIKKAVHLIKSDNRSNIFGGRGIVYRLVLDAFFEWSYFDAIGIASPKAVNRTISLQSQYGYSCARILLTLLCNKQSKNSERFFVNPEESVNLADLYSMVKHIMNIDDFVNIIDGMYSLKNKKYWNHLVTFDNIWSYSPEIIKEYIINHKTHVKEENSIYIRATTAGQIFAGTLCTHFEYFSSRFCSEYRNIPLFFVYDLSDTRQVQIIKRIINDVFNGVSKCCNNLEIYNLKVIKTLDKKHYNDILGTSYYYEKQFHEERIIHNHISYLEAYRNYIINLNLEEQKDETEEVNEFIISIIKKYLELLKYDYNTGLRRYRSLFFSSNSRNLYNELSVCIEKMGNPIRINEGIQITRQYYKTHFYGEICGVLKRSDKSE